jgi:hypothetical protein
MAGDLKGVNCFFWKQSKNDKKWDCVEMILNKFNFMDSNHFSQFQYFKFNLFRLLHLN